MNKIDVKTLAIVPIFTALTIIGAFLRIDIPPVPVTFQLFFCVCAGLFLGQKGGALSQVLYALLGLIGLPIFTSGLSGVGAFLTPTFGYIIGFPFAAWICGFLRERFESRNPGLPVWQIMLCLSAGLLVDYVFGVSYLYFILNVYRDGITFLGALSAGAGLFLVKDIILCLALAPVAKYILKAFHLIENRNRA